MTDISEVAPTHTLPPAPSTADPDSVDVTLLLRNNFYQVVHLKPTDAQSDIMLFLLSTKTCYRRESSCRFLNPLFL